MKSNRSDIQLLHPDTERDAPFALDWFDRPEGRETLLSMGNAPHEITETTLENERKTIEEFIDLETNHQQITRMIQVDNRTIGAVWIELTEKHGVKPPSIHIIIGDPAYRGKGIGLSVMKSAIIYAREVLNYQAVYSRHLASNQGIIAVNRSLGFIKDGAEYTDDNGLTWQNVVLTT